MVPASFAAVSGQPTGNYGDAWQSPGTLATNGACRSHSVTAHCSRRNAGRQQIGMSEASPASRPVSFTRNVCSSSGPAAPGSGAGFFSTRSRASDKATQRRSSTPSSESSRELALATCSGSGTRSISFVSGWATTSCGAAGHPTLRVRQVLPAGLPLHGCRCLIELPPRWFLFFLRGNSASFESADADVSFAMNPLRK